jgi:hypothetical protein
MIMIGEWLQGGVYQLLPNWRRASTLLLILFTLVLLTGCAKGTAHVTVQMDDSVDVAAVLRLDARTHALINADAEESFLGKLKAAGFPLKKIQDSRSTEYQYLRSYTSQEIKALAALNGSDVVDSDIKTATSWFYTKYDIEVQLHLNKYSDQMLRSVETLDIPKPVVRMLVQSFTVDFKLTLPFNLYGANNAAEQHGRTLTWPINLVDPDPIRMVIYVPKIRNIAMAIGGVVVILGGAVVYLVRRRRRLR